MVKPFAIAELVARVRLALRHSGAASPSTVLALADLELDQEAHRVTRAGQAVTLSPTEYKLLRYLLLERGSRASAGRRSSTTCGATTSTATPRWWRRT